MVLTRRRTDQEGRLVSKNVSLYDPATGEVLDGKLRVSTHKSKNGFLKWSAVNSEADLMMAKCKPFKAALPPMNHTDFRVYHGLRAFMEAGNLIRVPQAFIASEIGMAASHFNASVNRLVAMGIVEKQEKIGRSYPLRISPLSAWNGEGGKHRDETRGYNKGEKVKFRVVS